MLTDPAERFVVSSLGWVDGGALWILDTSSSQVRRVALGDAKYLSLHKGTAGNFAAVHHYDGDRLSITAHSFDEPSTIRSQIVVDGDGRRIEGSRAPWAHLPRHYVAYLVQPTWSDYALLSIDGSEEVALQTFEWFDDSYDKGYQGIASVTQVPDSDLILVSVQRSSRVIVYDPRKRRKVGDLILSDGHGNPELHFRKGTAELWAVDYDTIVKVDSHTWRVAQSRKVQEAAGGVAQFVGQLTFDSDESICAIARPFAGDVIGLDPESLRTTYRARVGSQPLEVALVGDRRVFARDWKHGSLLTGELTRVRFA